MVFRIRTGSSPGTQTLNGDCANAAIDVGERCAWKFQAGKNVVVGRQPVARVCDLKAIEQARSEDIGVLNRGVLKASPGDLAGYRTVRIVYDGGVVNVSSENV